MPESTKCIFEVYHQNPFGGRLLSPSRSTVILPISVVTEPFDCPTGQTPETSPPSLGITCVHSMLCATNELLSEHKPEKGIIEFAPHRFVTWWTQWTQMQLDIDPVEPGMGRGYSTGAFKPYTMHSMH